MRPVTINEYRKREENIGMFDRYSDDELAETLYNQYKDDERMEGLSLEEYKEKVITKEPEPRTTRKERKKEREQERLIDEEEIEEKARAINPRDADRKVKERKIIENVKRTFAGAGTIVANNAVDLTMMALSGSPTIGGKYLRANSDVFKTSINYQMIQAGEAILGKDSVEIVNRGGVPSLRVKDPTYKGGKVVTSMLALIPSVIVPGGLAAKATGKIVPKILKSKTDLGKKGIARAKTFSEFTVAGALGEQIGWDIYEPRLANLIGDFVADDNSAKSDIMRYLEADRDDSQIEARVGVLVESMLLSGGLALGWLGTKAATKGAYNNALKPATKAIMKNLRSLRGLDRGDERFVNFIRNLESSTQYGKKFPAKEKPSYFGKDRPEGAMKEGEDLSKLWHFKASGSFTDKMRKEAFDWVGGPFFQSRGYFTPRLFEVWRAAQNAKGAWSSRAIRITERLEGKLNRVAVDLFKGQKGSMKMRKDYVEDTFQKIQSYLDGDPIRLSGWNRPKKITLRSKTNGKFDIPKDIRKNLVEVRTLQDDLSELLSKSNLISEETRKIITSNLGSYLRRSYDLFEASGWKPSANVIQRAENYFVKEYRNQIMAKDGKFYFKDTKRMMDRTGKPKVTVANYEIKSDLRRTVKDIKTGKRIKNPNFGEDSINVNRNIQNIDEYIEQRARGDIAGILDSNKTAKNVMDYVDHVNGILPSTVKKRKNLHPAFRALLGQTRDPRSSIVNSIAKVADFVETDQFIKNAMKLGEGKYFFKDQTENAMGKFTSQILGRNLGELHGMHTTKEISRIFNQKRIYSHFGEKDVWSYFLALKGYGQASKTVLNHITHLRNTIGGATFMLANGRNPFSKETGQAFKLLKNELDIAGARKKGSKEYIKAYDDMYEKFRSLGIVNNNVRAGEFRQLIEDASTFGIEQTSLRAINKLTGVKVLGMDLGENLSKGFVPVQAVGQRLKKIAQGAQKLYIAEDDIFKISSYLKELDTLKRANSFGPLRAKPKNVHDTTHYLRPVSELEQEAARIVKNTIPNYDLVPQGLKQLRKMPFGNYFSFPAEMFRTSWHIMRQSGRELASKNPVIQRRGAQRMAGFISVGMLGSEAISEFSKMVYGVTDKMESAIRNLMEPEYSKNTKQIYYRDSEGNLYKNNFSYVDPYDVVKKPFRTIALAFADGKRTQKDRDKILFDGIMEALTDLATPFIEEAILSESIVDIYNHYARNGQTKDGRKIDGWNNDPDSSEAIGDNIAASLKHAFASFLPGSTPQVARAWQSLVDPKLESGQELEPVVELFANVTGIRWNKITEQYVEKSLERKIGTYSRKITEINKEAIDKMQGGWRDMAGYEHTYNEKDVVNTYLDLSKRHYKATMNLKLAQESAIDLYEDLIEVETGSTGKLPVNNIFQKQGLDKGKIQQTEYTNLALNRYSPLEITESTWDKIALKNDFKWMTLHELKAVISSYQRGFAALPLLDLERSEYRQRAKDLLEKRADEIFEERGLIERNKKFEGGVVSEDFPVANAIQNPSKRIDPSTNMPYDEPLSRLGFKGGGLMNGVSDPLSRLGFEGGGLMLSVGVSPVSEEQISKLKKALKKREAKRKGGRIGFQIGGDDDYWSSPLGIEERARLDEEAWREDTWSQDAQMDPHGGIFGQFGWDPDIDDDWSNITRDYSNWMSSQIAWSDQDRGGDMSQPAMPEIEVPSPKVPEVTEDPYSGIPVNVGPTGFTTPQREVSQAEINWAKLTGGIEKIFSNPFVQGLFAISNPVGWAKDQIAHKIIQNAIENSPYVVGSILEKMQGAEIPLSELLAQELDKAQTEGADELVIEQLQEAQQLALVEEKNKDYKIIDMAGEKKKQPGGALPTKKRRDEASGGRIGFAVGDRIRKKLSERRSRKEQEKVPIEEIKVTAKRRPPRWLKEEQEFYDERVIEGEFLNQHGKPVKLKPKVLEALRRVQAKIDVPLALADTYRSPEKNKEAKVIYEKNIEDFEEQGYWINMDGKEIHDNPPDFVAGEKSFHGLGQAFDFDQTNDDMYVGENKPGRPKRNEQLYKALQEEEILKQLPGEWYHWSAGEITN